MLQLTISPSNKNALPLAKSLPAKQKHAALFYFDEPQRKDQQLAFFVFEMCFASFVSFFEQMVINAGLLDSPK